LSKIHNTSPLNKLVPTEVSVKKDSVDKVPSEQGKETKSSDVMSMFGGYGSGGDSDED
jgi:hypothetical protein